MIWLSSVYDRDEVYRRSGLDMDEPRVFDKDEFVYKVPELDDESVRVVEPAPVLDRFVPTVEERERVEADVERAVEPELALGS